MYLQFIRNEGGGVQLVFEGTCCLAWGVIFDRRRDRGVVCVFSIFYAGGSVCGCMCVYTHAHTHTAQMGYSVVIPGVGRRHLAWRPETVRRENCLFLGSRVCRAFRPGLFLGSRVCRVELFLAGRWKRVLYMMWLQISGVTVIPETSLRVRVTWKVRCAGASSLASSEEVPLYPERAPSVTAFPAKESLSPLQESLSTWSELPRFPWKNPSPSLPFLEAHFGSELPRFLWRSLVLSLSSRQGYFRSELPHFLFEHIEHPAKLLDYFSRSNKSNINQQGIPFYPERAAPLSSKESHSLSTLSGNPFREQAPLLPPKESTEMCLKTGPGSRYGASDRIAQTQNEVHLNVYF